jgi:peptide/nickel transport system ATP-binding protein/oligopeptide transport system ATP-binding protein
MSSGASVLMSANNIKRSFPVKNAMGRTVKTVRAVEGVSLEIRQGETYGLVGESGCGKSTLGRTLLRLLRPDSGEIIFNGTDISQMDVEEIRPFRREMQMIFQDPYTSLNPRKRVGQILEEVLTIHKICPADEKMAVVLAVLEKVGLRKEHYYRYPHEFSGGQRQRIGLARSLLLKPRLIICDEPVSALDVSIQAQIINLLRDLQQELGLSYLFIAHDMSVIKYISHRVGVMYLGHLVEEADVDDLFAMPMHPYTKSLLSAVPSTQIHVRRERIRLEGDPPSPLNPPPGCSFSTRCPYVMKICMRIDPQKTEIILGHSICCHLFSGNI